MTRVNCVFVVDKDTSARKGLARLLRTAGYDVCYFASVNEFLDAVDSEATGCLVLDIGTSVLSGEDLQMEFEARGMNLQIIVTTVDDDLETKHKAQRIKAAALFRKPVDGKALLDAIDWALR